MLALTVTLIAAVYLFGPDLVSRFILGFVVPRRVIQQSKSEEITRAALVAVGPFLVVVAWVTLFNIVHWKGSVPDIRAFFEGLNSEKLFEMDPERFYRGFSVFWSINVAIIWRLYLLLILTSVIFDVVIYNYGAIRHSELFRKHPWLRSLLATVVLPRVSEWHAVLTSFALRDRSTPINADVLTRTGILYRGSLAEPFLGPDGALSGILLKDPRRFSHDEYMERKKNTNNLDKDKFWREIPSKTFLILADDIANINLRHYDPETDRDLLKEVSALLNNISLKLKSE